jgi:hypothetical protein
MMFSWFRWLLLLALRGLVEGRVLVLVHGQMRIHAMVRENWKRAFPVNTSYVYDVSVNPNALSDRLAMSMVRHDPHVLHARIETDDEVMVDMLRHVFAVKDDRAVYYNESCRIVWTEKPGSPVPSCDEALRGKHLCWLSNRAATGELSITGWTGNCVARIAKEQQVWREWSWKEHERIVKRFSVDKEWVDFAPPPSSYMSSLPRGLAYVLADLDQTLPHWLCAGATNLFMNGIQTYYPAYMKNTFQLLRVIHSAVKYCDDSSCVGFHVRPDMVFGGQVNPDQLLASSVFSDPIPAYKNCKYRDTTIPLQSNATAIMGFPECSRFCGMSDQVGVLNHEAMVSLSMKSAQLALSHRRGQWTHPEYALYRLLGGDLGLSMRWVTLPQHVFVRARQVYDFWTSGNPSPFIWFQRTCVSSPLVNFSPWIEKTPGWMLSLFACERFIGIQNPQPPNMYRRCLDSAWIQALRYSQNQKTMYDLWDLLPPSVLDGQ